MVCRHGFLLPNNKESRFSDGLFERCNILKQSLRRENRRRGQSAIMPRTHTAP
ncbi:hypothetical protein HMPREF9120_00917 [Neisseria sp. oral taxon 020 str. F0370]|nr:hypothetical protein HMPREF9120_00917 [Neisseria sp. oral taxon 020 str. F0370]